MKSPAHAHRLDGKHVVFGKVVEGMNVLDKVRECMAVSTNRMPAGNPNGA